MQCSRKNSEIENLLLYSEAQQKQRLRVLTVQRLLSSADGPHCDALRLFEPTCITEILAAPAKAHVLRIDSTFQPKTNIPVLHR